MFLGNSFAKMKSLPFLPLLATAAWAFVVPANTTNGVYKAYYDENGVEVHVRLTAEMMVEDAAKLYAGGLVDTETTEPLEVVRRNVQVTEAVKWRRNYCDCGETMDHSDCDDATEMIRQQIEEAGGAALVPMDEGIYGMVNGITSYICTPGTNEAVTPVDKGVYNDALRQITDACGLYVPGTYIHGDIQGSQKDGHGSSVVIGYKFNKKREDIWFCDNAVDPKTLEKCKK